MEHIKNAFETIGARVKFGSVPVRQDRFSRGRVGRIEKQTQPNLLVGIKKDRKGEFFTIDTSGSVHLHIMGVEKKIKHLLLFAKDDQNAKYRFLCGSDERDWFAAAVPGLASNIRSAMDTLKPNPVMAAQRQLRFKDRYKRKNEAFLRQGEWFFVPAFGVQPDPRLVLKNEPIRRGRGNPHRVEELFRAGGENVYLTTRFPNGISEKEYRTLIAENPHVRFWGWRLMRQNMLVYGRGKVTHRDHKAILLRDWHRIFPNRESEAWFIETLQFLD